MTIKRIPIAEFRALGGIQEINRLLLHRYGFALEVIVHGDGKEELGGIWDYRDDADGMLFNDLSSPEHEERAAKFAALCKDDKRVELYGWTMQPIGDKQA